jgi:hypothetical protein
LYEYETWSVISKEEHRLKMCGNTGAKEVFGPEREELIRSWRNSIIFVICIPRQILLGCPNIVRVSKSRKEMSEACGMNGEEKRCVQSFGRET